MSNGSGSNVIHCDNIEGLTFFGVETGVLFLLSVGSVAFNYIFLKVLAVAGGHLPLNTKVILQHCTIGAIGKSIGFMLETIYHVCLITLGFESLAMQRTVCVIIQIPYAISSCALLNAMVFIGFERLWSTWKKNLSDIELVDWKIYLAQIMVWVLSFAIYTTEMTVDQQLAKPITCYCYFPMIMSPLASILNNVIFIGSQSLNIVIYFFVYCKNKNILFQFTMNTARHSLSERFVMWANVKASKMLLPVSIVHAIVYDIIIAINYSVRANYPTLTQGYLNIIVFNHCILCVDTLFQPILLLRYNSALKEIAQTKYPKVYWVFGSEKPEFKQPEQLQISDPKSLSIAGDAGAGNADSNNSQTKKRVVTIVPTKNLGNKQIVDFRVHPEDHQEMLKNLWENADTKWKCSPTGN